MAYSKDIERLARSLNRQRLDRAYIKHYLIETYQLEEKAVDDLLERLGIPRKGLVEKPPEKAEKKKDEERKPPRQGFY